MEEKERYEIHIYDDICVDLYDNGVLDKSINDTYKLEELLNQQSKRIKELEEELDDAKRDYIPKLEFGLQRANKMVRDAEKENQQLKQQVEELKGKRLEFYNDDVRQTQVINGVHFDIEQLLVFSEYVEHEKNISADKDKQINQLKQQLYDLPKKIVGEIEKNFTEYLPLKYKTGAGFYARLNTILKKFGWEVV